MEQKLFENDLYVSCDNENYTMIDAIRECENEINKIIDYETIDYEKICDFTNKLTNTIAYVKGDFENGYTFEGHIINGQGYIDRLFDENGKQITPTIVGGEKWKISTKD